MPNFVLSDNLGQGFQRDESQKKYVLDEEYINQLVLQKVKEVATPVRDESNNIIYYAFPANFK